nr:uncharacterized protein LOC113801319 [Penaeus vannamei]
MSATNRTLPICSLASLPNGFFRFPPQETSPPRPPIFRMLVTKPSTRAPFDPLSSFLSSDTTDTTVHLRKFSATSTHPHRHDLPARRHALPISQTAARRISSKILLVSDALLEQFALKADAVIAAKTRAPTVATVPHPFAAAQRTELQAPFTIKTPVPFPHPDAKDKRLPFSCALEAGQRDAIKVHGKRSETFSLTGAPSQRFQWIFLIADVPQTYHRRDFLEHYGLSVDLQDKALIHQFRFRTLAAPTLVSVPSIYTMFPRSSTYKDILQEFPALSKPINWATKPRHEVRHHIVTHGPPAHSKPSARARDRCCSAKWSLTHDAVRIIRLPAANGHLVKKKDDTRCPHLHSSHKLSGCTVFSRIDLVKAYHQVRSLRRTSPDGRHYTVCLACSSFSGCPSVSTTPLRPSKRFINDVTPRLEGSLHLHRRHPRQHLRRPSSPRLLFGRLQEAGVVINPGKCLSGITPTQEKVTAIRKFPKTARRSNFENFLGMFNFLPGDSFPSVPALQPLRALIHLTGLAETVDAPYKRSLRSLQGSLASATLLNHPLPEAPLKHSRRRSRHCIGAVLQQRQGKHGEPLAFFSQTLLPRRSRYIAFRKELLAVYSVVRHFQPYMESQEFHILTDHKPLTFALHSRTRRQSLREERHLDYISQFTTDIRHIRARTTRPKMSS